MTPPGSVRALDRLLPFIALGTLGLSLAVVLGHAGSTLGYDLQAYVGAGGRVLHGQPLYDASADVAGPFAVYLYPPPFALVAVLLALLPGAIVTGGWTLLLVAAFLGGLALTPVSWRVRWLVVLLAALSWPFLYAIKLGQVEPLLILAFAATWRWLDRPAPVGISAAL
ncbi:MAG TPA: glycosyltransferase 87 family protein, partial [Candidatus Limnocylindrales bacterium]